MRDIGFRIVHLTDLHWSNQKANNQALVIKALISDLQTQTKDRKPDILVFSGDLVDRGANHADFDLAKAAFLDPVQNALAIDDSSIFLCPGNHDVDKSVPDTNVYLERGLLSELTSRDALNQHIDDHIAKPIGSDQSMQRLANYFSFIRKHYHHQYVYETHYVQCIVKPTPVGEIGIALFNSSWRSRGVGDAERHLLLIGERVVDNAANALQHCHFKIAVIHHPLDWLADWDRKYVETQLFTHFDIVLFGHVHETMPSIVNNTIGQCILAQSGCLYLHRDYYNGYQLIDFNTTFSQVLFNMRSWFDAPVRAFGAAENVIKGGLQTFTIGTTTTENKLTVAELLSYQAAITELADSHVRTFSAEPGATFDKTFVCPPLSHKVEDQLIHASPKDYAKELLALPNVIRTPGTSVIVGTRESGKTTLAFKIAKDVLTASAEDFRVPILVDFGPMKKYDKLDRLVRRHISQINLDIPPYRLLNNYRCLFLIDNIAMDDVDKISSLTKFISECDHKHDWILFLDQIELMNRSEVSAAFAPINSPVFIHQLNRSQVRSLVSNIHAASDQADVIIKLIRDNQLPRTPYMVTMLASVMSTLSLDSVINEAALLDELIDVWLSKNSNAIVRSSTDFTGQNIILEEVALWLSETDGYMPENELLTRVSEYFSARGIMAGAAELFQSFLAIGLLERVGYDIRFKYRSIEAFFLARYAARNRDYAPTLIEGTNIIKYSKEFSLLCDLSRKDSDLLEFLEIIIAELIPPDAANIDKDAFVKTPLSAGASELAEDRISLLSESPNTATKIDEMADVNDRMYASLNSKLRDTDGKHQGNDNGSGFVKTRDGKVPLQLARVGAYFQAWQVWGRAITSLDFVELKIRKPSFVRLLGHWARISSKMSLDGAEFVKEVMDEYAKELEERAASENDPRRAEKARAAIPGGVDRLRRFVEFSARVALPLGSAKSIFAHIGVASVHQLLIECFDELDRHSAEALGAACLLIHHQPDGWYERIQRYIDSEVEPDKNSVRGHLLSEACIHEYYFKVLTADARALIVTLLEKLFKLAGFNKDKSNMVFKALEAQRPKIELLLKERRF